MSRSSLFSLPDQRFISPEPPPKNEEAIETINGLQYIENFINEPDHYLFLSLVNGEQWLGDLKRRVQHYGFKYDYKARKVSRDMHIGELPIWLKELSSRLRQAGYMSEGADQVIVNEYQPGQGISGHIDCEPCFRDTIISLSLGSSCVMDFINKYDKAKKIPVWLAPRSLIVLNDEARYEWLHGIAARKWDKWDGRKYERQRRVSLTFRRVIIEKEKHYKKEISNTSYVPLVDKARSFDRAT